MKNTPETVRIPSASPMHCSAARTVSAVVFTAPPDAAIRIARGHHQRRAIQRPPRDLARFHLRHALGAAPLEIERGVLFGILIGRQKNRLHQSFFRKALGSLLHARVPALGKHDSFAGFQISAIARSDAPERASRIREA